MQSDYPGNFTFRANEDDIASSSSPTDQAVGPIDETASFSTSEIFPADPEPVPSLVEIVARLPEVRLESRPRKRSRVAPEVVDVADGQVREVIF